MRRWSAFFLVLALALIRPPAARADHGCATLGGDVVSEATGLPIEGALVHLDDAHEARSQLLGAFEIAGVEPGTWTLETAAVGYHPREVELTVRDCDDRRRITIPLRPLVGSATTVATVTATVADIMTGLPVAGATVRVLVFSDSAGTTPHPDTAGPVVLTTNAEGLAGPAELPLGYYAVDVSAPGYAPANHVLARVLEDHVIVARLAPNTTDLSVTITGPRPADQDEGPLEGVFVQVQAYDPAQPDVPVQPPFTRVTGEDGTVVVKHLPPALYRLEAKRAGYRLDPPLSVAIPVAPPAETEASARMTLQPTKIEVELGSRWYQVGLLAQLGEAKLFGLAETPTAGIEREARAEMVDGRAVVTFEDLLPGPYRVEATLRGFRFGLVQNEQRLSEVDMLHDVATVGALVGEGATETVSVVVEPGRGTLRGRVRRQTSLTVDNADFQVTGLAAPLLRRRYSSWTDTGRICARPLTSSVGGGLARSDTPTRCVDLSPDGRFALALPPGLYGLEMPDATGYTGYAASLDGEWMAWPYVEWPYAVGREPPYVEGMATALGSGEGEAHIPVGTDENRFLELYLAPWSTHVVGEVLRDRCSPLMAFGEPTWANRTRPRGMPSGVYAPDLRNGVATTLEGTSTAGATIQRTGAVFTGAAGYVDDPFTIPDYQNGLLFVMPDIPPGQYTLRVSHPRNDIAPSERTVVVPEWGTPGTPPPSPRPSPTQRFEDFSSPGGTTWATGLDAADKFQATMREPATDWASLLLWDADDEVYTDIGSVPPRASIPQWSELPYVDPHLARRCGNETPAGPYLLAYEFFRPNDIPGGWGFATLAADVGNDPLIIYIGGRFSNISLSPPDVRVPITVEGVVRNVRDPAQPVVGETVQIAGCGSTTTNAQGEYRIRGLGCFTAPDLDSPRWLVEEVLDADSDPATGILRRDILAAALHPVAGKVTDERQRPIEGVQVRLLAADRGGQEVRSLTTDAQGAFSTQPGLRTGVIEVEYQRRGYLPHRSAAIRLTPAALKQLPDVALKPVDGPVVAKFESNVAGMVLEGVRVHAVRIDNPTEATLTAIVAPNRLPAPINDEDPVAELYLVRARDGKVPSALSDGELRYDDYVELRQDEKVLWRALEKVDTVEDLQPSQTAHQIRVDLSGWPVGRVNAWLVAVSGRGGVSVEPLASPGGGAPLAVVGTNPWAATLMTILATIQQEDTNWDAEEIRKRLVPAGKYTILPQSRFSVTKDPENYLQYKAALSLTAAPGIKVPTKEAPALGYMALSVKGEGSFEVDGRGRQTLTIGGSANRTFFRGEWIENNPVFKGLALSKFVVGLTGGYTREAATESHIVGQRLVERQQLTETLRGEFEVEVEASIRDALLNAMGLTAIAAILQRIEKLVEIDLLLAGKLQVGLALREMQDTGWPALRSGTAERGTARNPDVHLFGRATPQQERTWALGVGLELGLKLAAQALGQEVNGWFGFKLRKPKQGDVGLSGLTFEFRRAPDTPVFKRMAGSFFIGGVVEIKLLFTKTEIELEVADWPILVENDTDSAVFLLPLGHKTTRVSLIPGAPRIVRTEDPNGPLSDRFYGVFPESDTAGAGSGDARVGVFIVSNGDGTPDGLNVAVATFEDGRWGDPEIVPGSERATSVTAVEIGSGELLVVWATAEEDEQRTALLASLQDADGFWTTPVVVDADGNLNHSLQLVAKGPDGAILAWLSNPSGTPASPDNALRSADFDGTEWSVATTVREWGPLVAYRLAASDAQDAVAMATGEGTLEVHLREGDAAWGASSTVATAAGRAVAATYLDDGILRVAGANEGVLRIWQVTSTGASASLALEEAPAPTALDLERAEAEDGSERLVVAWIGVVGFRETAVYYAVVAPEDDSMAVPPTDVLPGDRSEHTSVAIWPSAAAGEAWLLVRTLDADGGSHYLEGIRVSLGTATQVGGGGDVGPADGGASSGGGGGGCRSGGSGDRAGPVVLLLLALVALARRLRRGQPWLAVTACVLLAVACGSGGATLDDTVSPDTEGSLRPGGTVPCASDIECPVDQWCDGELCMPGCRTEPDSCFLGICDAASHACVDCLDDADCALGTCEEGLCVAGAAECDDDAGCAADRYCDGSGQCLVGCRMEAGACGAERVCDPADRSCKACFDDAHCTAGDACVDEECVTPTVTCGEFGFCPTGSYCSEGVCLPGCYPTFPDPCDPLHCDGTTNTCVECLDDGHCVAGLVCAERQCGPAPCGGDDDCASGSYCAPAGCVAGCRTAPDDCATGRCDPDTRACVACLEDGDCSAGERCDDGTCLAAPPPPCGIDADCPAGTTCQGDVCTLGCREGECALGVCDATTGACRACLDDGDCLEGWACDAVLGLCRAPCGSDAECVGRCDTLLGRCVGCFEDADCLGLRCDPAIRSCVPCLEDDDCIAGFLCDAAAARCVGCFEDADCDAGKICVEDRCETPDGDALCDACRQDADCRETGARCLAFTDALGSTIDYGCGRACTEDGDCPAGWECGADEQCRPRYVPDPLATGARPVVATCAGIRDAARSRPCVPTGSDSCGLSTAGDGRCVLLPGALSRTCGLLCVESADCPEGTSCELGPEGLMICAPRS